MRTKDEILNQSHKDITLEKHKEDAHLWLEVRKIEVLIDIRDILEKKLSERKSLIFDISKKD